MSNNEIRKSPPWETFYHELEGLFAGDIDVQIVKRFTEDRKYIDLYVDGQEKAEALAQLLPCYKNFGNVMVCISVKPNNVENNAHNIVEKAFENNPNVIRILSSVLPGGSCVDYVIMSSKILQFFDDDMSSYEGVKSMLLEDAARDVFLGTDGTYYCTEPIPARLR